MAFQKHLPFASTLTPTYRSYFWANIHLLTASTYLHQLDLVSYIYLSSKLLPQQGNIFTRIYPSQLSKTGGNSEHSEPSEPNEHSKNQGCLVKSKSSEPSTKQKAAC